MRSKMIGFRLAGWASMPLVLACAAAVGLTTTARGDLVIAEGGASPYRIVIADDAIPSERYAAEELQRYLTQICKVTLPITTTAEPRSPQEIVLGADAAEAVGAAKVDLDDLGSDGFTLRTDGQRLLIAGGKPRGTLYGVYALLEETLGVRWFTPKVKLVPEQERLVVPQLNVTQVPALEYREVFWTEMMRNADFAARHRLNGDHIRLEEKHGGRAVVYYPFVHSFDMLVPPALFAEHPGYFPLIDGQRKSGYVQRCLSNPDVVRISIERVRQWIQEHPDATLISVSQNDTFNYCQCPDCKALDDAEGSPAASLIRFVNQVAEAIAADHPDIRIDTLAYQYTRKPPKTLRPHPNVVIRLCSIECCFAHPLDGCPSEQNQRFVEDIAAWQPVAPRLYIWDYTTNFANYQQPFPNFDALQANVQFFVKSGVKGLFEQGNYSPGNNGELGSLRAYVLAKLLWNPETDVARHIDEFLQNYYGPAAGPIRAYLDLRHRGNSSEGHHAHIFDPPTAPYLDDTLIREAGRLFDEAERLAGDDAAIRLRVRVARLPIWYVTLATNRVTGDQRAALLREFLTVAREAGISHIREGQTLEAWAKQMGAE